VVQHGDSLSRVIGEYDWNDVRLSIYIMPISHVDEIVLIVFESNSGSFLELLWVIDINEVVVLHFLMTWMAWIAVSLWLVVKRIGRTFSFDASHAQMTWFCPRILDLVALAALLDVCLGDLPLRAVAACTHLGGKTWFIFGPYLIKFIRSLPSFPSLLTSWFLALERRQRSSLSF